jgi:hypothetical protein
MEQCSGLLTELAGACTAYVEILDALTCENDARPDTLITTLYTQTRDGVEL